MKKTSFEKLKETLPGIQKNVPLKNYTTFKIGGPAKYFFKARKKEDLIRAVKMAKEFNLPFFILGGGSNLLISDKGFKGLIIKISGQKTGLKNNKIYAQAGVKLNKLIKLACEKGLTRLEWAAGIPGTLGGAIYGNAQAFSVKISDLIGKVEVLDSGTLEIKNFSGKQCHFSSKNSVFKINKNLIIISALLNLKKDSKKEIKKRIKKYIDYRKKNHPFKFPSAGSIFINEEVKIRDSKLLKMFPELKEFSKKKVIPSAYLIEKCGLKSKKIGRVQISQKHANFIINLGQGKSADVVNLINLMKKKVKNKFGIKLEEEIQKIGF